MCPKIFGASFSFAYLPDLPAAAAVPFRGGPSSYGQALNSEHLSMLWGKGNIDEVPLGHFDSDSCSMWSCENNKATEALVSRIEEALEKAQMFKDLLET